MVILGRCRRDGHVDDGDSTDDAGNDRCHDKANDHGGHGEALHTYMPPQGPYTYMNDCANKPHYGP